MIDDAVQLPIGEVARRAGMRASRIRYYEAHDLLPAPERVSGKRRYSPEVLRQLAIIDAAQRVGFTLGEIRELLGSRDRPALERVRQLAQRKLPEIDALIERATAVRGLLQACSACDCGSLDVCELFDDHQIRLADDAPGAVASRLVMLREDVRAGEHSLSASS